MTKRTYSKYGLSFGFTGRGLLPLVLLLVAEPHSIPSEEAILSERNFPVNAGTHLRALTAHRTGQELSTLDSNISAPQPPGRPLAAAALIGGSSGLTGERALTALKQQGSYESLEKAIMAAGYGLRPEEQDSGSSGYRASNYAQNFAASFSGAGPRLTPSDRGKSDWEVEMRLAGYGYGDQLEGTTECEMIVSGNRVEYRRGAVTEWYVNDPRGLEQGFTIQSPPAALAQGEHGRLTLLMGVEGNLSPVLSEDSKGVVFHGSDGECLLRYDGLYAFDARGRDLPARLALRGRQVAIEVDDSGAVYPVVVDPVFTTEQKLTASDAVAFEDFFGRSVAISGDTLVVGAFLDDTAVLVDVGSAYVFVRSGSTWIEQAHLIASDPSASGPNLFGDSVAISGDTVVVGAAQHDTAAGTFAGSVYVFVRSGSTWTEQAQLTATDAELGDRFGTSVAISGDIVVVGAHLDDTAVGNNAGSAYVFVRTGSTWTEQAHLTASDAGEDDQFGFSVAISGDTVVVGAHLDDTAVGNNAGSAYVFVRTGSTWTEQAHLTASDAGEDDQFGISVAISDDTVVVGAWEDDTVAGFNAGAAYVVVRTGSTWTEQAHLTASDAAVFDLFGVSVAISGDTVVVGAYFHDTAADNNAGSAYVFVRTGSTWTEQAHLTASDAGEDDEFGISVAISDDTVVVGAWEDNTAAGADAGSAYVFRRHPSVDLTPPSCDFTVLAGPPTQVQITLQDTDSGLASIQVVTAVNCVVSIPPFAVGTTAPVLATATKIDQSKSARIVVQGMDVAQNVIQCDPVITTLELITVEEQTQTFSDISSTDNSITVQNGVFGLTTVSILVNGQSFALANLGNQEVRTIDVSSALVAGSENTISLTGYGQPGASALVIIADGHLHLQPSEGPALSISLSKGSATIRWTTIGNLESAQSVSGPWSKIAGATSPFTVPAAVTTFYRVRR